MKARKINYTILLFLLLFKLDICFASSNSFLGLSFGTNFINQIQYSNYYSSRNDDIPSFNLVLHFHRFISNNTILAFSLGKGFYQESNKYYYTGEDSGSKSVSKTKATSYPVEINFLFSSRNKGINPFFGIGIGTHFLNLYNDNYSGIAQSFSFGLNCSLSQKSIVFIEFKKLGLSYITNTKYNNPTKITTASGLNDIGISFGVLLSMNKSEI